MTISGEVNVRHGISGDLQMPRVVSGGSTTVDSELSSTSENPVQNKVIKAALDGKGTYSKPSDGIPKTDLASAVQTSLGKADTALQHQDIGGKADTALIAPTEASMTATRNYSTGDLLIVGSTLYKVTANIPSGGAISPETNVTATVVAEQLAAAGGSAPSWQLLGEYDIARLKGDGETWDGPITLTNLGGLTQLYFRWEALANLSTTASGFGLTVNGKALTANTALIPIAKKDAVQYGFSRAKYNGLTWEITRTTGATQSTNLVTTNALIYYNEPFDVGACDSLSLVFPPSTYRPAAGVLKIYGAK